MPRIVRRLLRCESVGEALHLDHLPPLKAMPVVSLSALIEVEREKECIKEVVGERAGGRMNCAAES